MNSAILMFNSRSHLIQKINSSDECFTVLCLTITSGPPSYGYLLDPNIKKGAYYQNNFYITDRDDTYCYLTTEYHLDKEEYPPDVVLLNSLYGILFTLEIMLKNKIPKVTITNSGKRYTISSENTEPIIIDPDLGNLYNETIPRIIMRRVNNQWVPEFQSNNNIDGMYVWPELIDEELKLFYDLVIKDYNPNLLKTLYNWRFINEDFNRQAMIINGIRIENIYYTIYLTPSKKEAQKLHLMPANVIIGVDMTITKKSLIKFLETWESKLQYSDAFTLVFLGDTLRFFEGEPL